MRLCSNEGLQEEKTPPEGLETSYLCHMTGSRIGTCEDSISALQTAVEEKQNKIIFSTSAPTSSDGTNGDVWFVHS